MVYVGLFNRCYRMGESGWFNHQTPDAKSILEQDNFTWTAMEIIARKLNTMLAQERAKALGKHK